MTSILFFVIALTLVLGSFAIDVMASIKWWPSYFRFGLPLSTTHVNVSDSSSVVRSLHTFVQKNQKAFPGDYAIRKIAAHEIGVREHSITRNRTTFVRGYISYDETRKQMTTRVLLNWAPLAVAIIFVSMLLTPPYFLPLIFLTFLITAIYVKTRKYKALLQEFITESLANLSPPAKQKEHSGKPER